MAGGGCLSVLGATQVSQSNTTRPPVFASHPPQHPDGYWAPSPGVALSLLAQKIRPKDIEHLTYAGRKGWQSLLVILGTSGNYTEANASVEGKAKSEARQTQTSLWRLREVCRSRQRTMPKNDDA